MGLPLQLPDRRDTKNWEALDKAVREPVPGFEVVLDNDVVNALTGGGGIFRVPFDRILEDTHPGSFDLTTDLWTCRIPGIYVFAGGYSATTVFDAGIMMGISIANAANAELRRMNNGPAGASGSCFGSTTRRIAAGDQICLGGFQGGTTRTANGGGTEPYHYFRATWLSP